MRALLLILGILLFPCSQFAKETGLVPVPVKDGTYYGVNYTTPFAHAYRALGQLGIDRRRAIDRDVYHMARLGLNAFRLHLWDVELADGQGNLIADGNEHLELLDYLIAQLEKRGIAVVLTAQTNFGNGYPERNTDPNGAFTYKYDKCDVHDNPAAQQAQENYLRALVSHINPFTGRSYAADPDIIAIEINNEPCHNGSVDQITAYINRMTAALRASGWGKEILYNVSHNLDKVQGYYDADIDGTTYQWYPTGLVRGSQRHGNFLPMLDSYDIPFDTVPGFEGRSRVVYEYDPADVLDTYLYPAAVRSFRKAGFTWATQFAYDPIDMAKHNTEYQTHFLNLAYTPGKAVGMMIAAEAMRLPLGADYGKYPIDTVFGPCGEFLVSARRNLALLNDGEKYYHTNSTDVQPVAPSRLRAVAGVGSSPIVTTDGTGAYFLDKLGKDVWRLEVMPDVLITSDPFAKPSLDRSVAETTTRPISLALNGTALKLFNGKGKIYYKGITPLSEIETADNGKMAVAPGVYLISSSEKALAKVNDKDSFGLTGNMAVGEYVIPVQTAFVPIIVHEPPVRVESGSPIELDVTWVGNEEPDSIVVYPSTASFWNSHNTLYPMEKTGKYTYSVNIPAKVPHNRNDFRYRIVAFADGKPVTYPAAVGGTPLDWDFAAAVPDAAAEYVIKVDVPGSPVELLRPASDLNGSEMTTIPESWRGVSYAFEAPLAEAPRLLLEVPDSTDSEMAVVTKYVAPTIKAYTQGNRSDYDTLRIYLGQSGAQNLKVGLVNADGFTYTATVPTGISIADIPLSDFTLDATVLSPAPYPAFLKRTFIPDKDTATPLLTSEIESVTIEVPKGNRVEILGIELR